MPRSTSCLTAPHSSMRFALGPLTLSASPMDCVLHGSAVTMAFAVFGCQTLLTAAFLVGLLALTIRLIASDDDSNLIDLAPLHGPLALYTVAFLVSSLAGIDPANSFSFTTELKRILIAWVVANAVRSDGQVKVVLVAIFTGAVTSVAYAYYQWWFGGTYTFMHVTQNFSPGGLTAPVGFSSSCNDLATLLSIAYCMAVAPALFGSGKLAVRAGWFALACVLGLGLLRTLSRSALVGALFATLLTGIIAGHWRRTLLLVLCAAVAYPLIPATLRARHGQFFTMEVTPNQFRVRMLEASVGLARQGLPWGVGRRNFTASFESIKNPGESATPNAHNNYANVLVEMGWLGLVALAWLQIAILGIFRRALDAARSRAAAEPSSPALDLRASLLTGLYMAQVAFIVAGMFIFDWGYAMPVTLMWITVGLGYAISRLPDPDPSGVGATEASPGATLPA